MQRGDAMTQQHESVAMAVALNKALLAFVEGGTLNPGSVALAALTLLEAYAKTVPRDHRRRLLSAAINRLRELRELP